MSPSVIVILVSVIAFVSSLEIGRSVRVVPVPIVLVRVAGSTFSCQVSGLVAIVAGDVFFPVVIPSSILSVVAFEISV